MKNKPKNQETEGAEGFPSNADVRPHIVSWYGQPVTELSKEELIEALEWCSAEMQRLQKDRECW